MNYVIIIRIIYEKDLILNLQLIHPKHCSEVHRIHLDVWPVNKFELILNNRNINEKGI
jgi:hypothetical protein